MNAGSSESQKKRNRIQDAMRFLKPKPTAGGSDDGSDTSSEKASVPTSDPNIESAGNDPCDPKRSKIFDQTMSDRFGEELVPGATIWGMYVNEAQKYDRENVEGRQQSLDILLLFAALFSIVIAVFLVESVNRMRHDPTDSSAALLLMIAQSQQRIELGISTPMASTGLITMPEFIPPVSCRWVNGLWLMAFGLSLSAALIAMLGKEWLAVLHSSRPQSARSLPSIRQSILRIKGLEDWGALHIISLIPMLIHASLLLFSLGFIVQLSTFDATLAAILLGGIGITAAFYFATCIIGAAHEFSPFVTGLSKYTRKVVAALFMPRSKEGNDDPDVPSIEDLQALVWLSKRSGDLLVIESAYQAAAGLHRSSYVVSTLARPRPNPPSDSDTSSSVHAQAANSLMLEVMERFEDLLSGKLAIGRMEPPVCRYVNAMIALGSCSLKSVDMPLSHWVDLLDKTSKLWSSNLPQRSLSGSNFAGVLIAEMDIFKLALDHSLPTLSQNESTTEATPDDSHTTEASGPDSTNQDQPSVETPSPSPELDQTAKDSLLGLNRRLSEWLQLSLTLLQSHVKGETKISPYLVDGLFRATSSGAYYLKRIYPVLHSQNLNDSLSHSRENILESIKISIFLLSQPANSTPESVMRLTEVLRVCSHITPMMLRSFHQQNLIDFDHPFNFRDLNSNPPTSRSEVVYISVRYMMILVGYLCDLLTEHPECEDIFTPAVYLVFLRTDEERDYDPEIPTPRQGVAHHMGDYISMLQFVASSQSNLDRLTRKTVDYICIIANYPWTDEPAFGMYIPSSLLLPLIRMFARSYLVADTAQVFVEMIVKRLRNPTLALSQLPPQVTPIPEPGPTIAYLQQITHLSGAFSDLVKAGSNHDSHTSAVARGIADIAIIAANRDPAFLVEPVELHAPAVPGFLEAISWVLPRLTSLEGGETLHNRFVVAASVLLVAACEDQESREQIATSLGRTSLLTELRDNKEDYRGIVAESEWQRLVNGLSLGEGNAQEGAGDELDQELEVAAIITTSQDIDLDIN